MTECRRCLYTDSHPFGLVLDDSGVCSGCRVHEEKSQLDWDHRFELLRERVAARRLRSRSYDCIVPVRGTPEHFYALDVIVNQLGLHPLVVAYNTQFNSRPGIRNLDLMRDAFDVDVEMYVSNPETYRKLVRESMVRMGSVRWPLLAGVTQFPVRTAVDKRIPLVIWPFHQPTEQVGTHSYREECRMSRRDRHEYDLMGVEPDELATTDSFLTSRDVEDLRYPSDAELARHGVEGIYLSNYVPWDSRTFSEDAVKRFGAVSAVNPRTFDPYDRVDDMTYMTSHDLLKQARLGYARVTDNLVREIRFGRIDRSLALAVRDHYQSNFPAAELRVFLDWIGMTEDAFRWILRRLPHGEADESPYAEGLSDAARVFIEGFQVTAGRVHDSEQFTIFGKGLEHDEKLLR